ncbi:MAG TPA: amidase [Longimicrobiaceae bacterium]|jgi:amidase|nr:amidase [Longimicrobiaceae bacterium]
MPEHDPSDDVPTTPHPGERAIARRDFLHRGALAGVGGVLAASGLAQSSASASPVPPSSSGVASPGSGEDVPPFELEEATVAQLQEAMRSGRMTSHSITAAYLARIEAMDRRGPALRAVIQTNPDALSIARQMDEERRAKGPRGPLHGIPVLLKDNVDTGDKLLTGAGSLALADMPAPRDAFIAQRLRAAGAVILGKANLSEWANFRSTRAASGWSGRGGQCRNPYALDRSPSGSSSGSAAAAAANFAAVTVGTETDGSIVSPSSACSVVGLKPTLGLVSRAGIAPISHTQDTAGPITRTVADAAALLSALAGVDPRDPATSAAEGHVEADYTKFLDANGLRGARIGVARAKVTGYHAQTDSLFDAAVDAIRRAGAEIVDPADIPHLGEYDDAEFTVLLYDFKDDLNRYLAERGPTSKVKTLADVMEFNRTHAAAEMPYFGQEIMQMAQAKGPLTDKDYVDALEKCRRLSRTEGIDAVMAAHRLDAIIAPTSNPPNVTDLSLGDHYLGSSSTPAAVAGYPTITVPAGYTHGLPVGLSFIGRAWSEPTLIRLAYAYEQATKMRRPPRFLPTMEMPVP